MTKIYLLGVLLGLGAVLAGAHAYPWVDHPRVASATVVVPNGGRAERFLVRLPADAIADFGGGREPPVSGRPQLPRAFDDADVRLEHFKLRDIHDNVIGTAARHVTRTPDGTAAAWALAVPGRGTLMLAGNAQPPSAVDDALRAAGHAAGSAWSGDLRLVLSSSGTAGFVAGSHEFAGLDVSYEEAWTITGVGADGALRATIELETNSRRRP